MTTILQRPMGQRSASSQGMTAAPSTEALMATLRTKDNPTVGVFHAPGQNRQMCPRPDVRPGSQTAAQSRRSRARTGHRPALTVAVNS